MRPFAPSAVVATNNLSTINYDLHRLPSFRQLHYSRTGIGACDRSREYISRPGCSSQQLFSFLPEHMLEQRKHESSRLHFRLPRESSHPSLSSREPFRRQIYIKMLDRESTSSIMEQTAPTSVLAIVPQGRIPNTAGTYAGRHPGHSLNTRMGYSCKNACRRIEQPVRMTCTAGHPVGSMSCNERSDG